MGVFDFPRIHVWGTYRINPGTANNNATDPGDELEVTSDSERVAALYRGMDDDTFTKWITQLDSHGMLRCQWNYYGDFEFRFLNVQVVSVQRQANDVITDSSRDKAIGGKVFLNRSTMIDTNPEGFNTTMIFADSFELRAPGALNTDTGAFVSDSPTVATTRFLSWYRNLSYHGNFGLPPLGLNGQLTSGAAGGASCSFQCGIPIDPIHLDDAASSTNPSAHFFLPTPDSPTLLQLAQMIRNRQAKGLLFRYNLYLTAPLISDTELAVRFANGERTVNPGFGQVLGTITPWLTDNDLPNITMGHFLKPYKKYLNPYRPTKDTYLSPCVAQTRESALSIDLINTLPDDGSEGEKFDMGEVAIGLRQATAPGLDPSRNTSPVTPLGSIQNDLKTFRQQGGIYDLPITPTMKARLEAGHDELVFQTSKYGPLLYEPEFMVGSDSGVAYLDECAPGKSWGEIADQLRRDPVIAKRGEVVIHVYRRGKPNAYPMELTIEQWKVTPTGRAGSPDYRFPTLLTTETRSVDREKFAFPLRPTDGPGLRTFRFAPLGLWPQPIPVEILAGLQFQEFCVDVRVLPYDDYSKITDSQLTWDLLYEKIFRYYYLLLPAMNEYLSLKDSTIWQTPTGAYNLLQRTDPAKWGKYDYMPRTRDLTKCRRELIVRFCNNILNGSRNAPAGGGRLVPPPNAPVA